MVIIPVSDDNVTRVYGCAAPFSPHNLAPFICSITKKEGNVLDSLHQLYHYDT